MSCCKRKSSTGEHIARSESSMFGLTDDQIRQLMDLRGEELVEELNSSEYNGINGILEKLKVERNKGLDSNDYEDLEQRRMAYGRNQIPRKPVSFIPFTSPWRSERQIRRQREEREKTARTSVLRNNRVQEILVTEVVVGDICLIKSGDIVPADGLIIEANGLEYHESVLRGEDVSPNKSDSEDFPLFSGGEVVEGSGQMVALRVGLNSRIGIFLTAFG